MAPRQLLISTIFAFIAGLSVASFAGFREFLPGLLQGALITVEITVAGAVLALICAVIAALAKLYGPAPVRCSGCSSSSLISGSCWSR
jgi:polar amino acid transport system permease protein